MIRSSEIPFVALSYALLFLGEPRTGRRFAVRVRVHFKDDGSSMLVRMDRDGVHHLEEANVASPHGRAAALLTRGLGGRH